MLSGKKIIVGVTGSIAAYKAAFLVRLLKKHNAEVRVILTEGARKFVTDLTFSNLSQQPVFSDLWGGEWSEHVKLGLWADMMVIAPATANTLAKMAHGNCDNALLAVYLSARCPVMVAPAMDADMYQHPATKANFETLKRHGVEIIPAEEGFLASGLEGAGRMAEPDTILEHIQDAFGPKPLAGKKVLVSAGPTVEPIDPVRFLSNRSTGTMGWLIAQTAQDLGAAVTLVSGPVNPNIPYTGTMVKVESAAEMFGEMTQRAPAADIVIMSAAVADYTPTEVSATKIKKKEGDMSISLKRTQDILNYLGQHKPNHQVLVGFALETDNELEHALGKLQRKNLDYIVLNSLRDAGAGFGTDTNKITMIDKTGREFRYPVKSKAEVAMDILVKIATDNGYLEG